MKNIIFILIVASAFLLTACNKEIRNTEQVAKIETKKDKVEIITEDKIKIAADYYYHSAKKDMKQPLIILIHQFRSSKKEWDRKFIDTLLSKNYKVLAYDIRNHGESGKAPVQEVVLLSDKVQAPLDVDAVMGWAINNSGIDSGRIGVVGTSIGGSLGIYGRIFKGVKSAVAVSSGKNTFQAFTGYDDRMMSSMRPILRTTNVMFVCGTADNNYLEEEKSIYDNYLMEPREILKFETEKHGKELIAQYPEILIAITNWFNKTL